MKIQLATGYLAGRLQELADQAYRQDGRWWTEEGRKLEDAINSLFRRETHEINLDV